MAVSVGVAAAAYGALWAVQSARADLKYFSASEFGVWWPLLSHELLRKLDRFRGELGVPVSVSPVTGAIGRLGGGTQHAPSPFVLAIDVFPKWLAGGSPSELSRAYEIARNVGFTGIGVYPDTSPAPMLHLDVRRDRRVGSPATWARFKRLGGGYDDKSINEAFV